MIWPFIWLVGPPAFAVLLVWVGWNLSARRMIRLGFVYGGLAIGTFVIADLGLRDLNDIKQVMGYELLLLLYMAALLFAGFVLVGAGWHRGRRTPPAIREFGT